MMEDYGDYSDYDYDYDDDDDQRVLDELSDVPCLHGKRSSCEIIPTECLLAAQREELQRVMDLLSLKEHQARTLLIHYQWDVEKVFAIFVEKGKDKLYTEACVIIHDDSSLSAVRSSHEAFCEICMENAPANEFTMMDCGHYFCNTCWTEHFVVKINDGHSRRISCMAHKCNAICDEGKIRSLVGARDPYLAEKFDRFLLQSYIEDNKKVKWCPSVPHCGNAIRVTDTDECYEIECACGLQFCFNCSSEVHSPCSCRMWELWTQKNKDASETVNWITANTKPCPKCHKPVEKNGGCNLVCCVCKQPFCWLCGEATGLNHTWSSIEGHSCGRYKEEYEKKSEDAKTQLLRYVHYHDRYEAHRESLKAEALLKERIGEKISILENRQLICKDYSWVTNGVYRLFRSRQILSYSYPFAYYMFGDFLFADEMTKEHREIKQHLFEDQQQQLEIYVERLSMFLEEPFDEYESDQVMESRMKIINLSKLTDNICRKLYDCIDNELLLQTAMHIAPYRSEGAEKAKELTSHA